MFTKKIEFGNYTLKFGEDKVLLDYFTEIVMPSFFEMKYKRKYRGQTEYFFLDTELIQLDNNCIKPELAIKGKLVKNTKIKRYQIFKEGDLVDDKKELESAPSSSFLLILSNHRLVFTKEVPNAPTIKNFESISNHFLTRRHEEYINEQYLENEKKITKKLLYINNSKPFLRITPLTASEDLNDFILRFDKINNVKIKLLPTNNEEIDNDDFWTEVDKKSTAINSVNTKVEFSNNSGSLKADQVYEQVSAAVTLGNSAIKIKGNDEQGDTISGNNDDFKLTVDIKSITETIESFEKTLYREFTRLVSKKIIAIPRIPLNTFNKIKNIYNSNFS